MKSGDPRNEMMERRIPTTLKSFLLGHVRPLWGDQLLGAVVRHGGLSQEALEWGSPARFPQITVSALRPEGTI